MFLIRGTVSIPRHSMLKDVHLCVLLAVKSEPRTVRAVAVVGMSASEESFLYSLASYYRS